MMLDQVDLKNKMLTTSKSHKILVYLWNQCKTWNMLARANFNIPPDVNTLKKSLDIYII